MRRLRIRACCFHWAPSLAVCIMLFWMKIWPATLFFFFNKNYCGSDVSIFINSTWEQKHENVLFSRFRASKLTVLPKFSSLWKIRNMENTGHSVADTNHRYIGKHEIFVLLNYVKSLPVQWNTFRNPVFYNWPLQTKYLKFLPTHFSWKRLTSRRFFTIDGSNAKTAATVANCSGGVTMDTGLPGSSALANFKEITKSALQFWKSWIVIGVPLLALPILFQAQNRDESEVRVCLSGFVCLYFKT